MDKYQVYATASACHSQGIKVAIDGLTCKICLAGKRFADLDSEGNLMICSFIREPVGNLLYNLFESIWNISKREITCLYLKQVINNVKS
jgi:MoaA/NifB/PqqE/SkfB family radical SAM enzyme